MGGKIFNSVSAKKGKIRSKFQESTGKESLKHSPRNQGTNGVWGDPGAAEQNLTGEKNLGNGKPSKIHCYMGRTEELWGILGFIKADTLKEREKQQQKLKMGEPSDAIKQIMEQMNSPE